MKLNVVQVLRHLPNPTHLKQKISSSTTYIQLFIA